jgi:arylsulfatase A-like enzyme
MGHYYHPLVFDMDKPIDLSEPLLAADEPAALAAEGLKFTNFYVGPSCSPTRSMLFSGNDNHVAGLGNMHELLAPNQVGQPGYEGFLNDRVVSMASLMRTAG